MKNYTKRWMRAVMVYFAVMAIIAILFQSVWMISFIPSESMADTIQVGDFVFSSRLDIGSDKIGRYDILIFTSPDEPDITYIKRVIGMPGEVIEVSKGKVYADGMELDDNFMDSSMNQLGDGIYTVPEDCYFFLGDNRNNSMDSRFWKEKFVPQKNIQAKAKFVLFPFSDAKEL